MDFTVPRVGKANLAKPREWHGIIAIEGRRTMDGRILELGALKWWSVQQGLPLELREDDQLVGTVDQIKQTQPDENTVVIEGYGRVFKHVNNRGLALFIDQVEFGIEEGLQPVPNVLTMPATVRITKARVCGVNITDRPAWSVCVMDFPDEAPTAGSR